MAQMITASIYGANKNDWGNLDGKLLAFGVQTILLRDIPGGEVYSGVTCHTVVQLLPYGPSPSEPQYYTPTALATLVTAANA